MIRTFIRKADLPPVWALITAGSTWVLGALVPIWRFDLGLLGPVIMAAGLVLIIWCASYFSRAKTPIRPGKTPTALLTKGPYRLNRNPIYTFMTLILLGLAIWIGALSSVIYVFYFPLLITRRFIKSEETALRAAFGAQAEEYLTRTRRW